MRIAPVLLSWCAITACGPRQVLPPADSMIAAASEGRVTDLLRHLDAGADPNGIAPGYHQRPLVEAVRAGHDTVVFELLRAGADPLRPDSTGRNAWDAVMQAGHAGIADRLMLHAAVGAGAGTAVLRWFAGVRGDESSPPRWQEVLSGDLLPIGLMYAAHHDRADLIATMRRGREIPNPTGYHALAVAARWGHLNALRALLAIDVHPDLVTARRTTALMEASRDGHQAIATALLAAGADPDHPDAHGETALHWARRFGQSAYAALLERAGADPARRNVSGQLPIDVQGDHAQLP